MFQEYTVLSFLLDDPLTPVDQLNSDQVITDQLFGKTGPEVIKVFFMLN